MNPFRPLLAYLFFSHKIVRWFSPHIIILLYVANALLLTKGLFYQVTFGGMTLALIVAVTKILPSAYYFLLMNFAMLKGFFLAFKRERSGGWKREERSDE